MTFLSEIIDKLIDNPQNIAFEKTIIIIPNQRAKKMLYNFLSEDQRISKPCFAPQIISINDFIESLSPYKNRDKESLIIILFKTYIHSKPDEVPDFNKFIGWVTNFLTDINEIDLQMVNASEILSNIADIKELESSFGRDELSKNQSKYLQFYQSLLPLYNAFREELKKCQSGYEGMIYRDVAENIHDYAQTFDKQRLIFAGFHALSESEIRIIQFFYQNRQTEFIFDIDNLYKEHYAPFVKKLQERLELSPIKYKNDFAEIEKDIHIIGVSKKINQIYYAIDLLNDIKAQHKELPEEEALSNTVLVFADESLLAPFVHAYDSSKANFTMGYPFNATAAAQLIKTLFSLIGNAERFDKFKSKNEKEGYYHKDVVALLQNHFVSKYFFTNPDAATALINKIILNNNIFIAKDDPDFHFLFSSLHFQESDTLLDVFFKFFTHLQSKIDDTESFDNFFITTILEKIQEIKSVLEELNSLQIPLDLSVIQYFLNEKLSSVSLPFRGDFAHGLQIMGLLETRTLDFENVIILSVNEGNLPKGKSESSLIMFDVKRHFKLPTHYEKDSIFAYHFFRLLQRAKNIHLIYDNDSSTSLAEKSRFITQLEFEIMNRDLQNIHLFKDNINLLPSMKKKEEIVVNKTERILDNLKKLHYSPSSIHTYINCPLQFYFSKVEKIEPSKSINENVEKNVIGTIVHEILKNIFIEIKQDRAHYKTIIEKSLKNIENIVNQEFKNNKDIGKADITRGKNYLATQIVQSYLKSFLIKSKELLQNDNIIVLELEKSIEFNFPYKLNDNNAQFFTLKGYVDRIDLLDGKPVIYDYKTGSVKSDNLAYSDIEDLFSDSNKSQLFQLLYYAYVYCESEMKENLKNLNNKDSIVDCGIIAFQQLSKGAEYIIYPQEIINKKKNRLVITPSILQEFKEELNRFFVELMDLQIPFTQAEDEGHCSYCDFKKICKREAKNRKY